MKISYLFVIISFFSLNLIVEGQETDEWKLVKQCNDIKVFVMKSSAFEVSKVKVETVIETTLSELVALMKDSENHDSWVFLNDEAGILEVVDDFNWVYYGRSDAPWPISDRDFVTHITLLQKPIDRSVILSSFAIPDYLPEIEDCVRIHHIISKWTFNPIGNGSIHITLELEADIGGKIPVWFTNMLVTKGPLSTMDGLVNVLKTNKYKGVELDYIEEF